MDSATRVSDAQFAPYLRTLATALAIGIAGFALGLVFVLAGMFVFSTLGVPLRDRPVLLIVLNVVMLQGLGFGSVALGYLYLREEGIDLLMLDWPGVRDFVWFGIGVVGLFAVLIKINLIYLGLGIDSARHGLVDLGAQTPELLLVLIPLSLLLIGPGEELLFRGVIQQLLRDRFGVAAGITLASLIFAFAHVTALRGEGMLATLAIYIALSLVLGAVYEYSENLVVPALIHGTFNAVQFLLLYVVITRDIDPALVLAAV